MMRGGDAWSAPTFVNVDGREREKAAGTCCSEAEFEGKGRCKPLTVSLAEAKKQSP